MFLMLLVGCLLRRSRCVSDSELNKFNSIVFHTLFPFLMFNNVYGSAIHDVLDPRLIIFTLLCVFAVYFGGILLAVNIEPDRRSRGAMIQAVYRSNFVIMGLPIAANIYGHSNVGITAIMVAIVVPVFNVLAVVTFESCRGGRVSIQKITAKIITNPLILGAAAGIVFVLSGIHLPAFAEKAVDSLSAAATPIALIILGASFDFGKISSDKRDLIIVILMRLIVVPGVVLTASALLGIRDISFVTLVAVFAAPCAISGFTMAMEMDSNADLAGNAVVFTSALSCFTMFGWLFLFRSLGMF